jgi:hypothetical protein
MAAPFAWAAKAVQECAPPGGVWGPDNTFRSKIVKYDDQTAIYMSQSASEQDKNRWFRSTPLSWTGGEFKNFYNQRSTVVAEGDGYKVTNYSRSTYSAHFACGAPARP